MPAAESILYGIKPAILAIAIGAIARLATTFVRINASWVIVGGAMRALVCLDPGSDDGRVLCYFSLTR